MKTSVLGNPGIEKAPPKAPPSPENGTTRALRVNINNKYNNYLFACMHACLEKKGFELKPEEFEQWVENAEGNPAQVMATWNKLLYTNIEEPRVPQGLVKSAMDDPSQGWIKGTQPVPNLVMAEWMDHLRNPEEWALSEGLLEWHLLSSWMESNGRDSEESLNLLQRLESGERGEAIYQDIVRYLGSDREHQEWVGLVAHEYTPEDAEDEEFLAVALPQTILDAYGLQALKSLRRERQ